MDAPIPETLPSAAYIVHPRSYPRSRPADELARNIGISSIMSKSNMAKLTIKRFDGVLKDFELEVQGLIK